MHQNGTGPSGQGRGQGGAEIEGDWPKGLKERRDPADSTDVLLTGRGGESRIAGEVGKEAAGKEKEGLSLALRQGWVLTV